MKPLNAIAIIRINARLPILPWGLGIGAVTEAFLSFSPGSPSAEWGGRVLRKGAPCPLVGAFLLGL